MEIERQILRLRPQNLAIIPESLAPHLEKVGRSLYDRFQSSDLFDFAIFHILLYSCK